MENPVRCLLLLILLLLSLTGCEQSQPISIGFLGGLSGRVADLGLSGRNGATLACEEINRAGGINGRKLELILADDQQDPQTARAEVQRLVDEGVLAIVGPMTSAMAMATVDLVNKHQVVMLSPTVTTEELTGKDDYFLRVCSGTDQYSANMARHLVKFQQVGNVAVVYDLNNRAFTESWFLGFKRELENQGGALVTAETYRSGPEAHFSDLAKTLSQNHPDAILSIASAMDTAMLSQQLRKQGFQKIIAGPSWSATEQLLNMGGQAVEGVILCQFFDRLSKNPAYLDFLQQYRKRFREEPGFVTVAAYDAVNLLASAMRQKQGKNLKASILQHRSFSGLQQSFSLNQYGDAIRKSYITMVKDGNFSVLE